MLDGARCWKTRPIAVLAALSALLLSGCGAAIGDGKDDDRDAAPDFASPSSCGDGAVADDEACDDGNTDPLDGCSASCAVEAGWACESEPSTCSGEALCPGLPTIVELSSPLASCAAFRAEGYRTSGLYALDPDGAGGAAAFMAPCDMATADGGWTMLTRNAADDDEPSGCLPRIATGSGQACGTPACDADFALPAAGLAFTEMVWAAYDESGGILTYTRVRFDDPVSLPSTDQWSVTADEVDLEVADWPSTPTLQCNWFGNAGLRRIANETPDGTTGGYPDNLVVTFFDENADDSDPGKMAFTDASNGSEGSAKGLDDFQDGFGCADQWEPRSARGASSFVMVR